MLVLPCLRRYAGATCLEESLEITASLGGATWTAGVSRIDHGDGVEDWFLDARVIDGQAESCAAGVCIRVSEWSRGHELVIPGVVYHGNRFESRQSGYPPKHRPDDCRLDVVPLIADIPRLDFGGGPSRIQLLAGGMARPAVAAFDPSSRSGWILLAPANVGDFESGFDVRESADGKCLEIRVTAPGVREQRYEFMNSSAASSDCAADFATGEGVAFQLQIHRFPCANVEQLFAKLFDLRHALLPNPVAPSAISTAEAFRLVEDHYNRDFWWEEAGLYGTERVGENHSNPYQTGWCGGIIAEYALLASGSGGLTRERCLRHFDSVFSNGIAPSGLFFGKYHQGAWRSDCWYEGEDYAWRRNLTLVRRQGDALLYSLRAFDLLEKQGFAIPDGWLAGARRVAEALVQIWQQYGQFGHWLDQSNGAVVIGNSASGGIIPAALCAAESRFGGGIFQRTACEAAELYYQNFTRMGFTTGGPGDALQCPDSESAYALVESFVELHELTGYAVWCDRAVAAVHQFATWVMPYDYRFPPDSLFGKRGIRSCGAVFANAQNGHAAPGICTHSGLGLIKLSQATGDPRFADLAREIARMIPQCVSTAGRPLIASDGKALPSGWINERVNTSDWDNNIGGVFHGPCWSEVSLLLSNAELPQ